MTRTKTIVAAAALLLLGPHPAAAFSPPGGGLGSRRIVRPLAIASEQDDASTTPPSLAAPLAAPTSTATATPMPRRSFLDLSAALAASTLLPSPAHAVLDPVKNSAGKVGDLSPSEAEERFRSGRSSLAYLLANYDDVCDGGGDNVRRYLGTVGTSSGLFGIQKAMRALADRAEDVVEYTELSREVEQTIEQADGSAYMAIFVTTSTSYTPPAKYFKDAKIEIERCAKAMDELAAMIGLEL